MSIETVLAEVAQERAPVIVYVAATAFRRRTVYHRDPRCLRVGVRYDRQQGRYVPSCVPVDEAQAVGAGLRPCPLCTAWREGATR